MFLQQDEPPKLDLASKPKMVDDQAGTQPVKIPPPVNRTAKPSVPSKPASLAPKLDGLAAPEPSAAELSERSPSPFSTPPSSGQASPEPRKGSDPKQRERNTSDASFVERLRSDSGASSAFARPREGSDASWVQRIRGESDASYAERARAGSNASFVEPSSLEDVGFQPPPIHHAAAARREQPPYGLSRAPTMPARYRHARHHSSTGDMEEDRPRLPARPELQVRSGRTSPNKRRSGRTSPSKLSQQITRQRSMDGLKRAATISEQPLPSVRRIPANKPMQQSALNQGFDRTTPSAPTAAAAKIAPAVPAPRRSADMRRPQIPSLTPSQAQPQTQTAQQRQSQPQPKINGHSHDDVEEVPPVSESIGPSASDFPDSSQANRRPPKYRQRPWQIPTDYDTRLCAVCGDYVVTSGYITKAWNLRTGELLLHMAHHENVKATSVAFRPPTAECEEEGRRVWVGTNIGEIHEIDVISQSVVKTRSSAHTRREVSRIWRYGKEMWTLDEGGELVVWHADASGEGLKRTWRLPRSATWSMKVGKHLWVAYGKEIRVFDPGARSDSEFQVLRSPLVQPGTGDVTSGTTLISKPDLLYFGHSDGKISIYSRSTYACQGVMSVSLYKIASLAGVSEYLWAGYNTGMLYVYDTSTTPWTVKKDWEAHEKKQICCILADPVALWDPDRLPVITLGTDNMLKLWDGWLEEDWLDARMQDCDSTFCAFRELTASVLTWNAGASKPHYLQQNKDDNNFFRDYLTSWHDPPDVLVFGFQELVDLEDKKVTAKSLFKSKKKVDSGEQEHVGHQYRAWRDHLMRCVEEFMPTSTSYTLLHTASMVGLFTCIFVKNSERARIKHVHTAEVKRGMGGLHGNKGALILRCVWDDSSLCFVNCHLAAGQTQTIHRNNDAAAILEAQALPPYPLNSDGQAQHGDVFAGGGDGSMILDHEICILNGDLNYRIDTMGRDTVIKHVQSGNLARLLERDQLLLSRKKNPGFRLRAFRENPITFAPTYKYNLHSDEYDNSEKRRSPAWCDRILYRGLGKVKLEEYRRWECRVSDHRPVSGRLRLRVKRVDGQRRVEVRESVEREFDTVKTRLGEAIKREYCVGVLGMSGEEARAASKAAR
jgi:hypothetical protein